MKAKSLVIFFAVAVAGTVSTGDFLVDFSKALPIQEIPGFWNNRIFKPTSGFHHKFDRNERVVGGNEARPNEHPYQCALFLIVNWWTAFCGCVLISDRVVLTAAHCLEAASSAQVVFGAHNVMTEREPTQFRITVTADRFIIHDKYNPAMLYNDIAIISLVNPIVLTEYIQPIHLPRDDVMTKTFTGEIATVSGNI